MWGDKRVEARDIGDSSPVAIFSAIDRTGRGLRPNLYTKITTSMQAEDPRRGTVTHSTGFDV